TRQTADSHRTRMQRRASIAQRPVTRIRAVQFEAARSKEKKSNADTEPQLHLVPLEIDEIEHARASGHPAPDLNAPRRRHEVALAEGRIKGRADIKRLPGEAVESEPVVVPKIAHLHAGSRA